MPALNDFCMSFELPILIDIETCEDCEQQLPSPTPENLGGGYTELTTYCSCGAIYKG